MAYKIIGTLTPRALLQMAKKGIGHGKLEEIAKNIQKKKKKVKK